MELARKALSLDDSLGGAHGLLGNIYIMRKEYEKGIMEAERAVELEPNGADAHAFLGMGLRFADRAEEAIPILKKAIRLDPHAPVGICTIWPRHIEMLKSMRKPHIGLRERFSTIPKMSFSCYTM